MKNPCSHCRPSISWNPLGLIPLMICLFFFTWGSDASALVIVRNFTGGSPPTTSIGKGNLIEIFHAAADQWERAILDDHTVIVNFGWAPIGGGTHTLIHQGGIPNRETEGTILFNNDTNPHHFQWWLDPTPDHHEEFQAYQESFQNLGGGRINVGRVFSEPVGEFASGNYHDLLSIALHEIGHALGKSLANKSWGQETTEGMIEVTAPQPYPGTVIPLARNHAGVTTHFHPTKIHGRPIMSSAQSRTRQALSELDIVANAQLSRFSNITLNPLHSHRISHQAAPVDFLPANTTVPTENEKRNEVAFQ